MNLNCQSRHSKVWGSYPPGYCAWGSPSYTQLLILSNSSLHWLGATLEYWRLINHWVLFSQCIHYSSRGLERIKSPLEVLNPTNFNAKRTPNGQAKHIIRMGSNSILWWLNLMIFLYRLMPYGLLSDGLVRGFEKKKNLW